MYSPHYSNKNLILIHLVALKHKLQNPSSFPTFLWLTKRPKPRSKNTRRHKFKFTVNTIKKNTHKKNKKTLQIFFQNNVFVVLFTSPFNLSFPLPSYLGYVAFPNTLNTITNEVTNVNAAWILEKTWTQVSKVSTMT